MNVQRYEFFLFRTHSVALFIIFIIKVPLPPSPETHTENIKIQSRKHPKTISKISQKCLKKVPKSSQKRFKVVSKMSQRRFKVVSKMSQKCPKNVSKTSRKYSENIPKIFRKTPKNDKFFIHRKYIVDKELVGPTLYHLLMYFIPTLCQLWMGVGRMARYYAAPVSFYANRVPSAR